MLTSTLVSGEAMPAIDWLKPNDEARNPKPAPSPAKYFMIHVACTLILNLVLISIEAYIWSYDERFQWILQKHKLQHDARIGQYKLKEVSACDIQSTFVFFAPGGQLLSPAGLRSFTRLKKTQQVI